MQADIELVTTFADGSGVVGLRRGRQDIMVPIDGRPGEWKQIYSLPRDRPRTAESVQAYLRERMAQGTMSHRSFVRGDYERAIVDHYYGDGTYDSPETTDAMIDEAFTR